MLKVRFLNPETVSSSLTNIFKHQFNFAGYIDGFGYSDSNSMVPRMRPAHYERVLRETTPSGGLQHFQDGPGAQSLHQTAQKLSQILQV